MLGKVRRLLQEAGRMSLGDLSERCSMNVSAMEKMLDMLIHKGKLIRYDPDPQALGCGGCSECNCDASKIVFYELAGS